MLSAHIKCRWITVLSLTTTEMFEEFIHNFFNFYFDFTLGYSPRHPNSNSRQLNDIVKVTNKLPLIFSYSYCTIVGNCVDAVMRRGLKIVCE